MRSEFIETGEIVNTHGIAGEVKLMPWSDSPGFLLDFKTLYLDGGKPLEVVSARVHKTALLVKFKGYDDVNAAMALKGKRVSIARADAKLKPGQFFLSDLIGLTVKSETGETVGTLTEVLSPSIQNVYVVEGAGETHMIPAVPEFVKRVDLDAGEITVSLIEGM